MDDTIPWQSHRIYMKASTHNMIPVTKSQDMHESALRMIRFLWQNRENIPCLPCHLNPSSMSDNLLLIHLVSDWSRILVASYSARSLEQNPLLVLCSKCSRCLWLVCKGMRLRKGRIRCKGMILHEEHAMPGDGAASGDSAVWEDNAAH